MENVNQAEFWQQRYEQDSIGWDMGQVSPPLKAYIDQLPESAKEQAILVPGAGNAYEVGYLHEQGFTNVTLVDFASAPPAPLLDVSLFSTNIAAAVFLSITHCSSST